MASVYKVKLTYRQGSLAATEQYWSQPFELTNTGTNTFVQRLNALIQYRTDMMFTSHEWVSVDIANVDDPRRTWLIRPGSRAFPVGSANIIVLPVRGTITITDVVRRPEQLRVAALTEMTFDNGRRRSRRFISTVPDDVTAYDDNTVKYTSSTSWWTAFNAWAAEVSSGYWQLSAKLNTGANEPKQVQKLVTEAAAPSRLGLQLLAGDAPAGWTAGTQVDVSGFRAKAGFCPCPTINGRWTISGRNDTLVPGSAIFYLEGSSAIDPTNWKIMGKVQQRGFDFFIIEGAEVIGTAIHKRGNGSQRRGRSKARCCGL